MLELLNDATASTRAFEEFYYRFNKFVLLVCRKACHAFDHSNELADDIFQQTFLKVLHKGSTFRIRPLLGKENYTGEIKSWLSVIAKNELIDFLRKNPDEKKLSLPGRIRSETQENISFVHSQSSEPPQTLQQQILEKGLSVLTEDEKIVLMTYMLYYNGETPNSHLPDDIIKGLADKLGVKPASLRQIKSRALQKIMKIKTASSITD